MDEHINGPMMGPSLFHNLIGPSTFADCPKVSITLATTSADLTTNNKSVVIRGGGH